MHIDAHTGHEIQWRQMSYESQLWSLITEQWIASTSGWWTYFLYSVCSFPLTPRPHPCPPSLPPSLPRSIPLSQWVESSGLFFLLSHWVYLCSESEAWNTNSITVDHLWNLVYGKRNDLEGNHTFERVPMSVKWNQHMILPVTPAPALSNWYTHKDPP